MNKKLEVDHIDGIKSHDIPENIRFLCRNCNARYREYRKSQKVKARLEEMAKRVSDHVRSKKQGGHTVRKKKTDKDRTQVVQESIDYSGGSVEMQVTGVAELEFRQWMYAGIRSKGELEKKEAINGGAERVGVNPSTTRRYLEKMISEEGKLIELRNEKRKKVIKDRKGYELRRKKLLSEEDNEKR